MSKLGGVRKVVYDALLGDDGVVASAALDALDTTYYVSDFDSADMMEYISLRLALSDHVTKTLTDDDLKAKVAAIMEQI